MSYEYDAGSTRLLVQQDKTMDGVTPMVLVQAMDLGLGTVAVAVKPEDASALALAILEAAGIKPSLTASLDCPEHYERRALAHLETARKLRARKAERDAEAAKVRAFVETIPGMSYLDESPEHWQVLYRAAWEFFTPAEKPAPRVLQYGDPEPDRDTKWVDQETSEWVHDGEGWHWVSSYAPDAPTRRPWQEIPAGYFPMTEVTE